MKKIEKLPFHAVHLRVMALVFMLLDHMWATVIPGNFWMNCVGRLAFPIFAFQAAEGYWHTSDFKKYCKRLLVFALISEIPFNLMTGGGLSNPYHQNVLFTILLGLLGIRAVDRAMKEKTVKDWAAAFGVVCMVGLAGNFAFVDYGYRGVFTVIAFGVLRNFPLAGTAQLLVMVLLHGVLSKGRCFELFAMEIPYQAIAVFSLVFIRLYNGDKGPRNRIIQYGSYWFYPVHMAILWGIRQLL